MSWLHTFVELFIPADLVEIPGTLAGTLPHPETASISGTRIVLNQIDGTESGTVPHPDILVATGGLQVGGYDRDYQAGVYLGIAPPSCVRAQAAFAPDLTGALTSFAANTIRRTDRGLLIEPSRTNFLIQSATLGTSWTKTNTVVTDNQYVAPDGNTTMDAVADNSTNAQHSISMTMSFMLGLQYCWSIYIDPAETPRAQLDFSNAAFVSQPKANFNLTSIVATATSGIDAILGVSMDTAPNGTYRIGLTATCTTTVTASAILARITTDAAAAFQAYVGSGTKIGAWAAQCEVGPYPTSPIITTTATAARDGDVVTTSFNAISRGAIVLNAQAPPYNGTHVLWQWDDGTEANRYRVYRDTSGHIHCVVTSSSTDIVDLDIGYVCPFGTFSVFFAWQNNDFAASLNGNSILAAASGTAPLSPHTIRVGSDSSGNQWESWISRETLYFDRIADAVGLGYCQYPPLFSPRPQILLDTDIDSDIDDVVDLLLLLALEKQAECDIAGICVSSANTAAAGCLYAILNYYHRTAIPVGQNVNAVGYSPSRYDSEVVAAFGVPGKKVPSDFITGLEVYRQVIAAAADNSISIVTTGGLSSLNDFINSPADSISPLTGRELMAQKVRMVIPVAGYWPTGPAVSDMNTSKGFANNIFTTSTAQIAMGNLHLAEDKDVDTGGSGSIMNLPTNNPARYAWIQFWTTDAPPVDPNVATRTGWSQVFFLALVRGFQNYMLMGGENGRPFISANGLTTFYPTPNTLGAWIDWYPGVSGIDVTNTINELIGTGGIPPVDLVEAASAADSISVIEAGVANLSEAASASDTISATTIPVLRLVETASADDGYSAKLGTQPAFQVTEGFWVYLYTPLINWVGYDPSLLVLQINFKDGTERTFAGVNQGVAQALINAPDPDRYYNNAIKGSFSRLYA